MSKLKNCAQLLAETKHCKYVLGPTALRGVHFAIICLQLFPSGIVDNGSPRQWNGSIADVLKNPGCPLTSQGCRFDKIRKHSLGSGSVGRGSVVSGNAGSDKSEVASWSGLWQCGNRQ